MVCTQNCPSPCERCTRIADPENCENKNCKDWKAWFLRRWRAIHAFGQRYGAEKKR